MTLFREDIRWSTWHFAALVPAMVLSMACSPEIVPEEWWSDLEPHPQGRLISQYGSDGSIEDLVPGDISFQSHAVDHAGAFRAVLLGRGTLEQDGVQLTSFTFGLEDQTVASLDLALLDPDGSDRLPTIELEDGAEVAIMLGQGYSRTSAAIFDDDGLVVAFEDMQRVDGGDLFDEDDTITWSVQVDIGTVLGAEVVQCLSEDELRTMHPLVFSAPIDLVLNPYSSTSVELAEGTFELIAAEGSSFNVFEYGCTESLRAGWLIARVP